MFIEKRRGPIGIYHITINLCLDDFQWMDENEIIHFCCIFCIVDGILL